jgi:hypothetical protein
MARMRMSRGRVQFDPDKVVRDHPAFPTRGRNLLRVQVTCWQRTRWSAAIVFVIMGDPPVSVITQAWKFSIWLPPAGEAGQAAFQHRHRQSRLGIGQPANFFVGCALNATNERNAEWEVLNAR